RASLAWSHGSADGLRRLGGAGAGEPGAARARRGARRVGARRPCRSRDARVRGIRALRVSARLPCTLLREAALPLRAARTCGPLHVPRAGAGRRRARRGARAALRDGRSCGLTGGLSERTRPRSAAVVADVLDKALAGERIDHAEALALLESRDLVPIGRAANELRGRRTDPGRVTFII